MNRNQSHASLWIGLAVFIAALALYIATLAPGLVFGDPAEYTFVPHIGGIAHPPGYALYTVLAGIWQRMVPVGDIVYRTNLLSAFAGAGIAALVYGCVWAILPNEPRWQLPAVFAGLSTIAATDLWQHSIHANAHIITALLAVLSIFLLLSWRCHGGELDGWLWAFCLTAGLSVTHHPLLVFSFPAYTVFILTVRPGILFQPTWRVIFASPRAFLDPRQWMLIARNPKILAEWGTLARMVGFGLLGLLPWLYLPLVNLVGEPPIYGPGNTDTLNGFLDLVLARGLRVNLFAFGLAEQPLRLRAFWELLSLQIGWPFTVLMVGGLIALWAQHWRVGLLFTLMLAVNLLFILNTIQDVMAYLLVPFAALMILLGVGVGALLEAVEARIPQPVAVGLATLLLAIPAARTVMLAPRVSLAGFAETAAWIDEAYRLEEGYLLAHWEHLTPLWVESWVRDNPPADLELVFVAANSPSPWLDNVQAVIDSGPVYVSGFQPELARAGYRQVPVGLRMYRVFAPGEAEIVSLSTSLDLSSGEFSLVGVDLPTTNLHPGEAIPLSIAMSVSQPTDSIYFPYAVVGDEAILFDFTTDSHLLSPNWLPGEVITERYNPRVPLDMPPGTYPLRIAMRNLTTGETLTFNGETLVEAGAITVGGEAVPAPDYLLANIEQQVGIVRAQARGQAAPWETPISAQTGSRLRVMLTWQALNRPDENWKAFVHLIDGADRVVAQQDTPPLGGAFPTYLWFPKWVRGQTVTDTYSLTVPADLPPGEYRIQVGMYGFNTLRRGRFYNPEGGTAGDRLILGPVLINP